MENWARAALIVARMMRERTVSFLLLGLVLRRISSGEEGQLLIESFRLASASPRAVCGQVST